MERGFFRRVAGSGLMSAAAVGILATSCASERAPGAELTPPNKLPIAESMYVGIDPINNLKIRIHVGCTVDIGERLAGGIWHFGDGNSLNVPMLPDQTYTFYPTDDTILGYISADYVYEKPGKYTITAQCVDEKGKMSQILSEIKDVGLGNPTIKYKTNNL